MVCLFSSPEYAQFWVFGGSCVSLTTSHCHGVSFCVVLCVVSAQNSGAIPCNGCISAAEYEHSSFFWKPCSNYFQSIFTENKMKRKRTDGESAEAVREQAFLSRYKSEPGIVESSVSRPACCQYCHYCPWSVAKNSKYSNFSEMTTIFLQVDSCLCLSVNRPE